MDIVYLRDLRIDTVIGIFGWERRIRQTLVFDLEMSADIARAAASDAIEDTLNYKSVAKRLIQFVGESEFQLVETLAERCAEIIREEFGVRWVRLTLNKKGAVRGASDVGVIIERGERF
ncbi:MAG: dihydroneopterin aldolase [Sedimenticolaceae bacterium]